MKLKLLILFTLFAVVNAFSQTYTVHNIDGCENVIQTLANNGAGFTYVVDNPDTSSGNTVDHTNAKVSQISLGTNNSGNVSFKLPFSIAEGKDFTYSIKIYSPSAGSNSSGSGRFEIRFFNSEIGISGASSYLRQRFNKVAGWQEITNTVPFPTNRQTNAGTQVDSFDAFQILPAQSAPAKDPVAALDGIYFDDLKFTGVDDGSGSAFDIAPYLADPTADLETGNTWYAEEGKSNATFNTFRIAYAQEQTTPTIIGNTNATVTKVTRSAQANHNLRFSVGDFDYTSATIKLRIYPVCTDSEIIPFVLLRFRKSNAADNTNQLETDEIYLHRNKWNEIEITNTDLTGTPIGDNLYDDILMLFNNDIGNPSPSLEYFIDSFQGPQGTTVFNGTNSNDWADIDNWNSVVPNAAINTSIPASQTVVVSSTTGAEAKDLTIDGSLTVESGGSLIVDGNSSGDITYNVGVSDTNWHLVGAPVSGEIYNDAWVTANSIASGQANNRGIAMYQNGALDTDTDDGGTDTATGPWVYMQAGASDATFMSGTGYSLLRTAGTNYAFTGTYNATEFTTSINQDESNWNLLANPYSSYVLASDVIAANTVNLTDTHEFIYVFDNDKVGGAGYSPLAGTDYIAPGQGFFVNAANSNGSNFTIPKSLQTHQTGVTFYKNSPTKINVLVSDGTLTKITEIEYSANATTSLDKGIDVGSFTGVPSSFGIYSHLVTNNEGVAFMKQLLPNSDYDNMVISLGIKADAGKELSFTSEALNIPEGVKVYLEDKVTNTFNELTDSSVYKVVLDEALNDVGRFYLHTKSNALSVDDNATLNSISIYKTTASTLRIAGLQQGDASVKLYNILGKQVLNSSFEANGVKDIALPQLATGVYIVQLQTASGSLSKKIIME
ncbi:T9SS type A sorting domain-containing protein [Polaribacter vadi]|uniref:T9SS type A sorting domain-containing protein n=1 Tax=Polaribacter TaxID=52959 RepID=UPI001C09DA61|nr:MULTISPECIES: T9SS type A sorting domain-containing protein [Polaribacter]MBU3011383.1 T9SS type A sorting domain-containing protein [Polaribacter vadi]MDO6741195.1 T9SS type A sorting domain-containing protein [Polaribacter sp. 1_MG-2023]